jgi:hypothetical protein
LKTLTLYIGTRRRHARRTVVTLLDKRFPSFTVIAGEGHFQGKREPMWFVKIATLAPLKVLEAARDIRAALKQENVGIEYDGEYYSCNEDGPPKDLKRLLKAKRPS